MAKAKAKTAPKEKKMEPALPDEKMEQEARNRLESAAAACLCALYNRDACADMVAKQDLFNATLLLAGVISARSKTRDARPDWVKEVERVACFSDAVRIRVEELLRQNGVTGYGPERT